MGIMIFFEKAEIKGPSRAFFSVYWQVFLKNLPRQSRLTGAKVMLLKGQARNVSLVIKKTTNNKRHRGEVNAPSLIFLSARCSATPGRRLPRLVVCVLNLSKLTFSDTSDWNSLTD